MILIDADALKDTLGVSDRDIEFAEMLDEQPTVYAVPVIRCKDCKYFELDHIEPFSVITVIVAHEICTKWGRCCKTNENGFCHLAERK